MPLDQLTRWLIVELFAKGHAPAMLADRDRLLDWRPDLVVREAGEVAGPAIAALAGVPWVDHSWGPMRPRQALDDVAPALGQLCEEHGLQPHPDAGFFRWAYLDVAPPTLHLGRAATIDTVHLLRLMSDTTDAQLPPELQHLGQRRAIYVTP